MGYCCGLDWGDGPNMACEACGLPVASRIDDCSLWQALWLAPDAVHRLPVDDTDSDTAILSWEELLEEGVTTPPMEPISRWGSLLGLDHWWSWSPQWEAAAGRALAHLLGASDGQPVTVPPGLITEVFQRALDALLPADQPARRAVLAGPGLSVPGPDADMILVLYHPQTGNSGARPDRTRLHARWHCRSGYGCGWPSPNHTSTSPPREPCPTAYCATTRPRRSPTTCSEPTREPSSTPWSDCQRSAARGCAKSSTTSRATCRPVSSSPWQDHAGAHAPDLRVRTAPGSGASRSGGHLLSVLGLWHTFRESGGRVSSDRQTGEMRIESVARIHAVRLAVTVGAVVVAPVLLVAGTQLRRRMLLRYYREDRPGLVSKKDGWVSPGYFVVTNVVVRALCWPSECVLRRLRPA